MKQVIGRLLVLPLALALASCAQVVRIDNPEDASCARSIRDETATILLGQGENDTDAAELARRAANPDMLRANGPRPFFLRSPSGSDYGLFVDRRDNACLLRLYMRRRGFSTYTNNLSFIDTRTLTGCGCSQ